MDIRFYQKNGRIGAKYELTIEEINKCPRRSFPAFDPFYKEIDIGLLPLKVQEAGKERIREYAEKACRRRHQSNLRRVRKEMREASERKENVDRVIEVEYGNVQLQGRIKNLRSKYGVIVTLEKPFASKKGYVFDYPACFAEAVGGKKRVFDVEGRLTNVLLADAENAIVRLYKAGMAKQKHPKAVGLVNALNGGRDEDED